MKSTALRTQLEIAAAKAALIAKAATKQERRVQWQRRMDPAAYTCCREGACWIAEGPAGQRFEFSKTEQDEVLCISHTGGIYLLAVNEAGETVCDCPSRAKAEVCKHEVAFRAIKQAARMQRQLAQAA